MKIMSRKLAMPLLGILLWVMSIHAGTFATDSLLPRPTTGYGDEDSSKYTRYNKVNGLVKNVMLDITPENLNHSIIFASDIVNHWHRLETNLDWSDIQVKQGTPAHGQLIQSAPEHKALSQGKDALIATKATIQLMNVHCSKHKLTANDCAKHMTMYKLINTPLHTSCSDATKTCSLEDMFSKYRTLDGSCNHVANGNQGRSFTSYKRLLFPDYTDGIQELRRSVNRRQQLPSPRKISTEMVKHKSAFDKEHTLAVMEWTQFVAHDLSHTVSSKMIHSGKTIDCCTPVGSNLSPRYVHPFCASIPVPMDDEFYSKHGMICMSYVRSLSAMRPGCRLGPIEQLNQATHYLDASQVYGSDEKKALTLRTLNGGQLKTSTIKGRVFLPISKFPTEHCQVNSKHASCFLSGDSRVNAEPQLTALQTIWLREHNRIVQELEYLNPYWNDEILYQEARRIVIAEIQHITYNGWLTEIIGSNYASRMLEGSLENYIEQIDPSVSNSFATAAIRFVKSLVDGNLGLYSELRQINETLRLSEHFNKPMIIETYGCLDSLIRGLATQPCQKLDLDYVTDVTSHLYSNGAIGFDVLSLDIQRGRDHGLPSYTAFRSLCGLPEVETFKDLLKYMSTVAVDSLTRVYKNIHDIDLLVGGLSENPDGESLLGPTFSCIISDQFLRTRFGDRFFYTHSDQPKPFTEMQLNEIRKVTLARIFCDNGDNIEMMQPNVFKRITPRNALVNCSRTNIPRLDLKYWREEKLYERL